MREWDRWRRIVKGMGEKEWRNGMMDKRAREKEERTE